MILQNVKTTYTTTQHDKQEDLNFRQILISFIYIPEMYLCVLST